MLDFAISKPTSNSSRRVQSWLDSMYYHHDSSFDEKSFDKSSLISNNSTVKSSKTKNSRKSISTSTSSSFTNRNVRRRVYLRKPRYLVARTRRNSKTKLINKNSDQSSSYLSNYSSADESNLFSTVSTVNFLNDCDSSTPKLPEIKADDLDYESHNSLTTTESSSCIGTNNYSSNNHSFGILDFEKWENSLQLEENLTFKVRTYAFDQKDIKIKLKDNILIVTGKQTTEEENGWFKREFKKKFEIPFDADKKKISWNFDQSDHLIITLPRKIHSVH